MKIVGLTLFLFLISSLPVLAEGYIIIESISGVEIFADGESVGVTEEEDMELRKSTGEYELTAIKEGYAKQTFKVSIEQIGDSKIITLDMDVEIEVEKIEDEGFWEELGIKTASLEVRSMPRSGAGVRIDGTKYGETNSRFSNVPVGDKTIKVKYDEEVLEKELQFQEDEEVKLLADFGRTPPKIIRLFEMEFVLFDELPEGLYLKIEGEHTTVEADDFDRTYLLMGANHIVRITDGDKYLDYEQEIELTQSGRCILGFIKPPEMVLVEAGEKGGVIVENDFYIGKYHVTQAQFEAAMGFNPSYFNDEDHPDLTGDSNNRPVETVTWYDAVMFCNKLSKIEGLDHYYNISDIEYKEDGAESWRHQNNINSATVKINEGANGYRLPTEDEHEYVARGGKGGDATTYAGSNNLNEVGWYRDNSNAANSDRSSNRGTMPVGEKQANELGIYDMSGNVSDWTNTPSGSNRIVRGGSWYSGAYSCGVSLSLTSFSSYSFYYIGFRLARSP